VNIWLYILGIIYLFVLFFIAFRSLRKTKSAEDYILGGSKLGAMIGMMTFAATLFSTFTLMGMPDFFRTHGIGAWIFLGVSDAAMFFFILWFGYHLRKKASEIDYNGVAGLMINCYKTKWAGYIYFLGIFLFLVPYVAIQIRGIAIFFNAVFPDALPAWAWSTGIVVIMLAYSELGGLRAIIYNDVIQGTILLIVLWIIAFGCIKHFGGVSAMFASVQQVKPELLSVPGPQGLLTVQFLVASFLAILFMPVTQPQITTRLVIMRSKKTLHSMAFGLGIFTMLVLTPTIAIGFYGAVQYPESSTSDFLANVLLFEQLDIIAAIVVIGLLAAATSTADSQIFALGSELRSLMTGIKGPVMRYTRLAIMFFGLTALIFSILTTDQLVLLARVSFAGTAMMAPMILAGIFASKTKTLGYEIIVVTALAIFTFLASLLNVIPSSYFEIRLDLFLFVFLALFTAASVALTKKSRDTNKT
jgi:solute:Na+ symporter, SSS family